MSEIKNITGIILAGGKSTRMGADKGFVRHNGIPFIQHIINALQTVVFEIIVVSDHPKYQSLGYAVLKDEIKDRGPVSGLFTGLKNSNTRLNLVLSCDVPFITAEILSDLLKFHSTENLATVCQSNDLVMPLVGVYDKNCMEVCDEMLKENELKMMQLLKKLELVGMFQVDPKQHQTVANINTPEELIEFANED